MPFTHHRLPAALVTLLLIATGAVAAAPAARAAPPEEEEAEALDDRRGDPTERRRGTIESHEVATPVPRLWLDLDGGLRFVEGRSQVSAGLTLGGSFDELVKPRELDRANARAKSRASRPDADEESDDPRASQAEPAPRPLLALDGALARGAVAAALTRAGTDARSARLDDLATRARVSGLVPEVRVRVARVVDEDQTLSPTEYDPDRLTASGGVSFYLEGRATFRLDRLVFADEEIAVERLRAEHERLDRDRVDDVLGALARWQRAEAILGAPDGDEAALGRAEVDAAIAAATLDVLTDGWFTRTLPATRRRSTE